jgi:hypothetical protein
MVGAMFNTRIEKTKLWVKATAKANCLPIGKTNNGPIQFIGKEEISPKVFQVIEGGVSVPYHTEIVKYLKDGALLALDMTTAVKAGVPLYIEEK